MLQLCFYGLAVLGGWIEFSRTSTARRAEELQGVPTP
jgi:hypothetical protein